MVQKGDCSGGYYCSTALKSTFDKNQSPSTLYADHTLPDVLNALFEFFSYLDYRSL